MQKKTKILLGTVLGASILTGLAIATPSVGVIYNVVSSIGTVVPNVFAYADWPLSGGSGNQYKVALETNGPTNVIQQEVKFAAGGTTGWHKHPGLLVLSLAADSGPVDWYDSSCHKTVYQAGDSWTEGSSLHDVVNSSSSVAHFLVTYVIAQNVEKRVGELAPTCAAAAGLE